MQIATGVHETIHLFCLFLISIEFIGVTLVNTIVQVSSVECYNTSSAYCTVFTTPSAHAFSFFNKLESWINIHKAVKIRACKKEGCLKFRLLTLPRCKPSVCSLNYQQNLLLTKCLLGSKRFILFVYYGNCQFYLSHEMYYRQQRS